MIPIFVFQSLHIMNTYSIYTILVLPNGQTHLMKKESKWHMISTHTIVLVLINKILLLILLQKLIIHAHQHVLFILIIITLYKRRPQFSSNYMPSKTSVKTPRLLFHMVQIQDINEISSVIVVNLLRNGQNDLKSDIKL